MSSEEPEIEISPAQLPERPVRPRPAAPVAVVGELGSVREDRQMFLHVRAVEVIVDSLPGQQRLEVGGLLVGAEWQDEAGGYLLITGATAARGAASTSLSVTFTHETWDQLLADKAAHYPDEAVVGWYHTHPGIGVFLSQQDRFIHEHFFGQPSHVALVVDPADFTWGIFYWQGRDLVAARGCYVYGEPQQSYDRLAELLGSYRAGDAQNP